MRKKCIWTSYFILATGLSLRHNRGIAESVIAKVSYSINSIQFKSIPRSHSDIVILIIHYWFILVAIFSFYVLDIFIYLSISSSRRGSNETLEDLLWLMIKIVKSGCVSMQVIYIFIYLYLYLYPYLPISIPINIYVVRYIL